MLSLIAISIGELIRLVEDKDLFSRIMFLVRKFISIVEGVNYKWVIKISETYLSQKWYVPSLMPVSDLKLKVSFG